MLEQQGLLLTEPHPDTLLHILDLSSSFNKDKKKWSKVTKLDMWKSFMLELNHPLDACGQLTSQKCLYFTDVKMEGTVRVELR